MSQASVFQDLTPEFREDVKEMALPFLADGTRGFTGEVDFVEEYGDPHDDEPIDDSTLLFGPDRFETPIPPPDLWHHERDDDTKGTKGTEDMNMDEFLRRVDQLDIQAELDPEDPEDLEDLEDLEDPEDPEELELPEFLAEMQGLDDVVGVEEQISQISLHPRMSSEFYISEKVIKEEAILEDQIDLEGFEEWVEESVQQLATLPSLFGFWIKPDVSQFSDDLFEQAREVEAAFEEYDTQEDRPLLLERLLAAARQLRDLRKLSANEWAEVRDLLSLWIILTEDRYFRPLWEDQLSSKELEYLRDEDYLTRTPMVEEILAIRNRDLSVPEAEEVVFRVQDRFLDATNLMLDLEERLQGIQQRPTGRSTNYSEALEAGQRIPATAGKRAREVWEASDTEALAEIRKEQKKVRLVFPKEDFSRLMVEIGQDIGDVIFTEAAISALQTAAEDYLVKLFQETGLEGIHRHSNTIEPKDVQIVRQIRGERQ